MQNFNNNYNYPNYYSQPQPNTYAFVNGIEGAKAYQVYPKQTVMLLDSDNPIVYKKTANEYGQASIQCFKLVPIEQEQKLNINPDNYVSKEDFNNLLNRFNALYDSLNKESDK